MADIIVVGNGFIEGKGDYIDSYDNVVRINYLDKPYKVKDRGKKITHWALIGSKKDIPATRKKFPTIKDTWIFGGPFKNQDKDWCDFVRAMIGSEPTTGFFSILKAKHLYEKVDIIGFDFFTGERLHYWEDDTPVERAIRGHNPDYEAVMVENWIRLGLVRKI